MKNQEGQDDPVLLTWLPDKFRDNWPLGSREEIQYKFWRWWISDRNAFSYFLSTSCPDTSYQVLSQLASVHEKLTTDFQDGCRGGYLGFQTRIILASFYLQITLILPTKFPVNWPFGSDVQNRFSRWPPWHGSHNGHLGFPIETILAIWIYKLPWNFLPCFESVGHLVQEKKLKIDFSIFNSGGHLVHWSRTILAILVESHLGNIPVNLDWNWPRCVGGVV